MIHIARHGHVENPRGVLYANLPGFRLSALGRAQASALGQRLRAFRIKAVYSSPLERSVETAAIATCLTPVTVPALADWEPHASWVGVPWAEIPSRDPARWAEFVDHPWIDGMPAAQALRTIVAANPGRDVLVIGHQDPLRAAMVSLTRRPLARLRDDPFPHGALRTLDPRTWDVVRAWNPPGASSWPTA